MYAPRKYFDLYPTDTLILPTMRDDDLDDVPPTGQELALRLNRHATITQYGQWHGAVAAYLASVSFADAMVGRMLDAVDQSPRTDDLVIVLLGDNGWHLGEKRRWEKTTLWEEATHIPLIIYSSKHNSAHHVCDHPVSLLDIYPTLIDLCGLPPKPELEGYSLAPLLNNPYASCRPPVATFLYGQHYAIRSRDWRYIRYADGAEELYDHTTDPYEWTNLASDPALQPVKDELAQYASSTAPNDTAACPYNVYAPLLQR
jgi:arylsulfatase A-like enzyme